MAIKLDIDIDRLRRAIDCSRQDHEDKRDLRAGLMEVLAGKAFGKGKGTDQRYPVNMMRLAPSILLPRLAASDPQNTVTTKYPTLKPTASKLESTTNERYEEMKLGETVRECAFNALFGLSIAKVARDRGEQTDPMNIGEVFVEPIDFDALILDSTATRWGQLEYIGDIYRVPYDEVMDNPTFDEDAKKDLQPDRARSEGQSETRVSDLSRGDDPYKYEYRDHVELADIFLPKRGLFITVPWNDHKLVLDAFEWNGPKHGPYHRLSFFDIPNNIYPAAPAAYWDDLNDMINTVMIKIAELIDKYKTVLLYTGNAADTAERIRKANHLEAVKCDNPQDVDTRTFAGVDSSMLAIVMNLRDMFSYMAGGLDLFGGLGPQSDTLGQDQLLKQSGDITISDMQHAVLKFTQNIMRDVAWYMYSDPVQTYDPVYRNKVSGIETIRRFGPEERLTEFIRFNFKIEPYSMQHMSPQTRLAQMQSFVMQIYTPMAQMFAQSGLMLDLQEFMDIFGRYSGVPEFSDLIKRQQPMGELPEGTPTKPGVTRRENVRINVPGRARSDGTRLLQEAMAAENSGGRPY